MGNDARDWKVELAQKDLIDSGLDKNHLTQILYRPFDKRYTYYTGQSRGFHCMPRKQVMKHMFSENIGLITIRHSRSPKLWNFAFVSNQIIAGATAVTSLDINYFFPLYLYPNIDTKNFTLENIEQNAGEKIPNINPELFRKLKKHTPSPLTPLPKGEGNKESPLPLGEDLGEGINITPESIFYYVYAVLYSNIYREKYKEFLKIDFPRIPFTKDYEQFIALGKLGERLANIHLLSSTELENVISKFPIEGNCKVEKVVWEAPSPLTPLPKVVGEEPSPLTPLPMGEDLGEGGKVYINKAQYFDGIKEDVWKYHIGGYQVCDKWLKDRKGRTLSLEEIKTYCKIVTALAKTIEIQSKIDELYE